MDNQIQNSIVSFIWGIADDCLRDVYVRGKYRDVILPMTVIRRLDAMLEDTKTDVLKMKDTMDKAGITNQWPALCNAADQAFCNASPFLLKDLTSRAKLILKHILMVFLLMFRKFWKNSSFVIRLIQ